MHVVFHGELGGENCSRMVHYFESRGASRIQLGDNAANWMFRVMDSNGVGDLAEAYIQSEEYVALRRQLAEIESTQDESSKIVYQHAFAASIWKRQDAVNRRLLSIYWRSPTYNYSRLVVSVIISFILGSSFITRRDPSFFTETDMRSRVSIIFLSFVIIGILAMLSVLGPSQKIRDMYYRHRDAGMYSSYSIGIALGVAEKWFIVVSAFLFTTVSALELQALFVSASDDSRLGDRRY